MDGQNEKLVLTVSEVAEKLGLSRGSVYQGCLRGEIPYLKVGKRIIIPRVQLERWLEGNGHK